MSKWRLIMNFYNLKKSFALAKDVEIDKDKSGNFNIFVTGNEDSGIYERFLFPNFEKKLGSYVIVDYNYKLYNETKELFIENNYNINKIDLNTEYNPFMYMKKYDDLNALAKTLWKNSSIIKNEKVSYYVGASQEIFRLVCIYVLNKVQDENKNINYVKRIIKKLKQNDFDYFKKIFLNIAK